MRRVLNLSLVLAVVAVSDGQTALRQTPMSGVVDAETPVEVVQGGFQRLEGPVAGPDGGLYFSDID